MYFFSLCSNYFSRPKNRLSGKHFTVLADDRPCCLLRVKEERAGDPVIIIGVECR